MLHFNCVMSIIGTSAHRSILTYTMRISGEICNLTKQTYAHIFSNLYTNTCTLFRMGCRDSFTLSSFPSLPLSLSLIYSVIQLFLHKL